MSGTYEIITDTTAGTFKVTETAYGYVFPHVFYSSEKAAEFIALQQRRDAHAVRQTEALAEFYATR